MTSRWTSTSAPPRPRAISKCEIFGDGSDHASGYILVHGGWNNSISVIARLDEHGKSLGALQQESAKLAVDQKLPSNKPEDTGVFTRDTHMRVEARPFKVEVGRTYHWRIERRGSKLSWLIDGKPFMDFDDPFPLTGPKHDRFGFSSWERILLRQPEDPGAVARRPRLSTSSRSPGRTGWAGRWCPPTRRSRPTARRT